MNIHKDFKEHSVAEFFKKNRQMLGYSGKIVSLTTVIHEYVTNALDACEEAGILPEIYVKLDKLGHEHYKLIVEDNGPGIPKKLVGKVFATMLAGTKFHVFKQARGQQGIGAAGAVMFAQETTGKPTKIITGQGNNEVHEMRVAIDLKTNSAAISDEKIYSGRMRGTRVETELKHVLYQKSEQGPDEYIRRTMLVNPHAKLTYMDPDSITTVYDRASGQIPKQPKEAKPHPKGLETSDLMAYATKTKARSVASFLESEFTRMSNAKTKEIQDRVAFDMNKRPQDLRWEEAEQVCQAIEKISFIAPPTDVLIPIGQNNLEKALENILTPEFKDILTRPAGIFRGGVPFQIEVAIAYGGKSGKVGEAELEQLGEAKKDNIEIMRFANRTPLLFDSGGCAITKAIQSVDWKRYEIRPENPLTIMVNFTSIHVPYTGAGKQSIASEDEVLKEIRLALMEVGRKVGRYVAGKKKMYEQEQKKKTLEMYIKPVADSLAKITGESAERLESQLRQIIEAKYSAELEEAPEPEVEEEADEIPDEVAHELE
ncbi:MAG: DNA topoisomerase VI subunit B [DPANN group archaeon]|nr:DNA topoisomerase VI subunit B [DPANN group archaeon]